MFNFQHLLGGSKAKGSNGNDVIQSDDEKEPIKVARPGQHSREHNVAISDEAKENPILAIRLLKETELSSKKIKAKLVSAPQGLSVFTQKFMEENDPTWEFQDDEEKARTALTYSAHNGDQNGFNKARIGATKALKKMEEPLTDDELQALAVRSTQIINNSDPNSIDNLNARRKADEEYKETLAQAAARRNQQFRATGAALPGDSRLVSGKAANPVNEAEKIKSRLDAGLPIIDMPSR
ncbi:hypothetical protein [Pectobacterium zantedeschiae]|uniref:hypothetical protein n=1 Tax=Pectobacterium zantedeschiae TaxID=2034769 RepID=UPI00101BC569|nr:hypothetical protein [Pectobacterium zantedeschiae]RYC38116.1 hypothetical protein DEH81_20140 [Pectobacterium zantedeschiae]